MRKVWGGRFSGEIDRGFQRFNASLGFDRRLLEFDIQTALAHTASLEQAKFITREESEQIQSGLKAVLARASADSQYLDRAQEEGVEDIHSFIESELVQEIGELGFKLNTGRSRNDQVATDLRLFTRRALDQIGNLLGSLQAALLELAERNIGVVVPGYTHLQKGQPVLWAHYLLAYFEMFDRDRARLRETRRRVNVSPLGAAALAGSNYPLDRELQASVLGFSEVCRNSLDAVSDRDFVAELLSDCCLVMIHLSRLSEDLILYSTAEFSFLELSDSVSTGSSLLPHKKNPDALELIRGKSGRVLGHHFGFLTVLKGLPMTYNKDLQEDKEPLFDTVDTVSSCLVMMESVLANISLRPDRLEEAASSGFTNATELADYLSEKGMAFRSAHELTGRIVLYALQESKNLADLTLEEYRSFSPLFQADLYEALSLENSLSRKKLFGGTAPERVLSALKSARARLEASN